MKTGRTSNWIGYSLRLPGAFAPFRHVAKNMASFVSDYLTALVGLSPKGPQSRALGVGQPCPTHNSPSGPTQWRRPDSNRLHRPVHASCSPPLVFAGPQFCISQFVVVGWPWLCRHSIGPVVSRPTTTVSRRAGLRTNTGIALTVTTYRCKLHKASPPSLLNMGAASCWAAPGSVCQLDEVE